MRVAPMLFRLKSSAITGAALSRCRVMPTRSETCSEVDPTSKIFVATDDQSSLDFSGESFGDRVAAYDSLRRLGGEAAGKGPLGCIMPAYIAGDRGRAARNGEEAVIEYLPAFPLRLSGAQRIEPRQDGTPQKAGFAAHQYPHCGHNHMSCIPAKSGRSRLYAGNELD